QGTVTAGTAVAGTVDTWTAGETVAAKCFTVWENKLVEAEADAQIRTCSTTPTTASNWSPATGGTGYQVGDPGIAITDLATWGRFLVVGKEDGLWTFDEDLKAIPRLPDLAVFRDP